MSSKQRDLSSSLKDISLSTKSNGSVVSKTRTPVVESWEEEASSGSDTETETAADGVTTPPSHQSHSTAPPPTPMSPFSPSLTQDKRYNKQACLNDEVDPWAVAFQGSASKPSTPSSRPETRPEKTDAVAKRLIAGALGVRAPKKTDEQKDYDRAIREKALKKREAELDAERRAKEESERAKAAAWED